MLIVGRNLLSELVEREKRLRPAQGKTLERRVAAWTQEISAATWKQPTDVKQAFGSADIIGNNRIVFDICGNNYRIIAQFNYVAGVALIRFAGTHQQYDKIDARTI
jgi:mRNA interferase HigB